MNTISVLILFLIVPLVSVAQTISPDSAAHARFHIEQNLDQPITLMVFAWLPQYLMPINVMLFHLNNNNRFVSVYVPARNR